MGVIKKKTAVRGTEGGVKYVCDVCSADITSTVRIRCAHEICKEYDLCVPCFSEGKYSREHCPPTHPYSVIEQHSIPIFTEEWGADEESLLLEGAETYGLGSWADIADHIGGYREKDEVRDHYVSTYVESSKFPLPEHASPEDLTMIDKCPRDQFQARKKRRIEERKEAAKNAPPAPPKRAPTSSVPSCHEVQGYMPGRLEFETEHWNEAEEVVQHMQFDPGDGRNPRTGELEPEMGLKMTVMEIYNHRLTARLDRKKIVFEHRLLDYRKNMAADKKRTKEERDIYNKSKSLARLMNHSDFEEFARDLEYELNLRQAIAQLQDWRNMRIGDLKAGEKYEQEKGHRMARVVPAGAFDRYATTRPNKVAPPVETPSTGSALIAPELPIRPHGGLHTPPDSVTSESTSDKKVLTNGNGTFNGTLTERPKYICPPLSNVAPYNFDEQNDENALDLQLLSVDERDVCSTLRIMPRPYTVMKENVMREAIKQGGSLKKKAVKEICRIDGTKTGKLFDFWVHCGWIQKG